MIGRKALVIGASGLTGMELSRLLLDAPAYSEVHLLVRNKLNLNSPKLFQHVVDFNQLPDNAIWWNVDDVFSCMGTTIAKAGSQEAFIKIDYEIPLEVFKKAHSGGARFAYLVSAVGSDTESSIFYSRVKGKLEQALKDMPWQGLHIYQPGVLIGERKETRKAERVTIIIVNAIQSVFPKLLGKYAGVKVTDLASAILHCSTAAIGGIHTYSSLAITDKAKQLI